MSLIFVPFSELFLLLIFGVIYAKAEGNICEGQGLSEAVYLPDPDDCTKYTTCWKGVAYPQVCPSGLFFNPKLQLCVEDESVCQIKVCKPGVIEAFPIKGRCVEYKLCVDGKEYEMTCGNGLYFSEKEGDCVLMKDSNCTVNRCGELQPEAGEIPVFPNEFDCTKYFICIRGEPIERKCATGAKFDQNLKKCVAGTCVRFTIS